DSEVDNFIAAQANSTQGGQEIELAQILVRIPENATAEQLASRLARAEQVRQQLKTGADFAKTAASYSDAPEAFSGGDLGWLSQVSEPIESPFGYHLIQVIERKTDDVSKERKRLAARQAIRERKIDEATQEWQSELRDRAYVEYRNQEQ